MHEGAPMLTRSFFTPHASRAALMIPIGAAAAYIATLAVDIALLQSGLLLTLAVTVGVRGVLTP
jgi:hypothetical protein